MNKIQFIYFLIIFFSASSDNLPQFGLKQDQVKITTYISFDKVHAGSEFKLAAKADIDKGWHINSNKPYEDYLIPTELSIVNDTLFSLKKISYPRPENYKFSFSENELSVFEGGIYIAALVEAADELKPGEYKLITRLEYQACNDKSCLAPAFAEDTLIISAADNQTIINEINQNIFKDISISYSEPEPDDQGIISSTLEGSGLFLGLIFVFLGGLALNLTPCVYPLIPITIGYFGGQSEGSTRKLFFMGLLFLLGMAVTYSVVGVVTSLTGAIFGALLQNPFVITGISLIFILLSLSMFGVYEFKLPDSLVQKAGGAKQGYYGAFFMGLTMGIVAAPCIGPFVIGLVTYVAAKGDPFNGFLLFFVLAAGLGTPYLLLAVFSGKIKQLPRAGEWMEGVKHIFGIILLGMALYFLLPLLPESISGPALPVYMVAAALYIIFFEKSANNIKGFRVFKLIFASLIFITAVYFLIPSRVNSVEWENYSEGIIPAEIDKRGVIIDFYADWCIPCKELDAFTFSDPQVIKASEDFYTYKADLTKSISPEVERLKEKFRIMGVPTVLILDNQGSEKKRITGFINADEFYEILKNI